MIKVKNFKKKFIKIFVGLSLISSFCVGGFVSNAVKKKSNSVKNKEYVSTKNNTKTKNVKKIAENKLDKFFNEQGMIESAVYSYAAYNKIGKDFGVTLINNESENFYKAILKLSKGDIVGENGKLQLGVSYDLLAQMNNNGKINEKINKMVKDEKSAKKLANVKLDEETFKKAKESIIKTVRNNVKDAENQSDDLEQKIEESKKKGAVVFYEYARKNIKDFLKTIKGKEERYDKKQIEKFKNMLNDEYELKEYGKKLLKDNFNKNKELVPVLKSRIEKVKNLKYDKTKAASYIQMICEGACQGKF